MIDPIQKYEYRGFMPNPALIPHETRAAEGFAVSRRPGELPEGNKGRVGCEPYDPRSTEGEKGGTGRWGSNGIIGGMAVHVPPPKLKPGRAVGHADERQTQAVLFLEDTRG